MEVWVGEGNPVSSSVLESHVSNQWAGGMGFDKKW